MKNLLFFIFMISMNFIFAAEVNFSMLGLDISNSTKIEDRKQFFELLNKDDKEVSLKGYTLTLYDKTIYRFDKKQVLEPGVRKRFYFSGDRSDVKNKIPTAPIRPLSPNNDLDYTNDEIYNLVRKFFIKYKAHIPQKNFDFIMNNHLSTIIGDEIRDYNDAYIIDLKLLDEKAQVKDEILIINAPLDIANVSMKIFMPWHENNTRYMKALYFADDSMKTFGGSTDQFPAKLSLSDITISSKYYDIFLTNYVFKETSLRSFIQGEKITVTLFADADYTKELISFTPETFTKKEYDTLLAFLSGGKNVDCSKDVYYKLRIEHDSLPHLNKSYPNGKLKLANEVPIRY